METLRKVALGIMMLVTLHVAAQETENTKNSEEFAEIEDFQLPTFSELSNSIATEYSEVLERLPDFSMLGSQIKKELRRGMLDQHSVAAAFHNLTSEHSILPNITTQRFQLRNSLNNIMFNGFDVFQAHAIRGLQVFGGR